MPWTILVHAAERTVETVYSGMQGGHTTSDLYTNMEKALKFRFPGPFHEAPVLPPKAPPEIVQNMEFWAAGLRLRGYDVRIFIERAQALNWLRAVAG